MVERYTVKELKKVLSKVPDDAIVCCQSDEEGNRTMVCMDSFVEVVGRRTIENFGGKPYEFVDGDEVEGVDLEKDKGKVLVIIQPMY